MFYHLATDLDLRAMGLPYFTYLRSLSDLEGEYRMIQRGEVPKNPTLVISIPTLLDPSLAPEGRHILKVLVVAPFHYQERWGSGNSESYHQIKETFSQKILQRADRQDPDISNPRPPDKHDRLIELGSL
jgi:beta-carotene ketolase (CrtO type)